MADIGDQFTQFLKAYAMSDFLALGKSSITDAEINSIFAKHKADFDTWLKVPAEFRDLSGRVPPHIWKAAQNDPIFTVDDAKKAEEEHQRITNPYSPIPNELEEHPIYHDLISLGIKITPAHIAAAKLTADEIFRKGYSREAADRMSFSKLIYDSIRANEEAIKNNPTLSEEAWKRMLAENNKNYFIAKQDLVDTARKDQMISKPEVAVINSLLLMQQGKENPEVSRQSIEFCIGIMMQNGRLDLLNEEMQKSKYQKRINDDFKALFSTILKEKLSEGDAQKLTAMLNIYKKENTPKQEQNNLSMAMLNKMNSSRGM